MSSINSITGAIRGSVYRAADEQLAALQAKAEKQLKAERETEDEQAARRRSVSFVGGTLGTGDMRYMKAADPLDTRTGRADSAMSYDWCRSEAQYLQNDGLAAGTPNALIDGITMHFVPSTESRRESTMHGDSRALGIASFEDDEEVYKLDDGDTLPSTRLPLLSMGGGLGGGYPGSRRPSAQEETRPPPPPSPASAPFGMILPPDEFVAPAPKASTSPRTSACSTSGAVATQPRTQTSQRTGFGCDRMGCWGNLLGARRHR